MDKSGAPETSSDPVLIPTWVGMFGKIFIQNNVLSADAVKRELVAYRDTVVDERARGEVDKIIAIVATWTP